MQHLSSMDRARNALERGDRFPVASLPSIVAESWTRCRALGLDPRSEPRHNVIMFSQVKDRRERNAALRRLALAEMQLLYSQIAGSNFMIALGDADGVVLDTISDQHFADSAPGRAIIPGSIWDESLRGTNALGLASAYHKPIAIYGREHYFSSHGHLSCMAAPILNSRGETLGLLDASCANDARQEHTHALVRMAAAQIENGLIFQECSQSFIFAFHPRAEYLDTISAGLVSVSPDGVVISLNRPAIALLAGLPAVIGAHFDELFEAGFGAAMDGLLNGGAIRIRDGAGSGVFMVCRQIGLRQPLVPSSLKAPPAMPRLVQGKDEASFICDDPIVKHAMEDLHEAAAFRLPVHITGETGTGKDLMARRVHQLSGRKGEFVAVNCGAVPENLFIAEIFGHERGAFTNARNDGAPGLARVANRGTLFLDEVADIPILAQTSLLRFLDSMEVRSVGGQKTDKVDVQIVSATNRNLQEMVTQRLFRADLYYRLNAFTIHLPPLRARSDFANIARHLMESLAPGTPITDAAISALAQRSWLGNVRELKTALQRALLRRRGQFVDEGCFDEIDPSDEGREDSCTICRPHPLSRSKCREIRSVFRATDCNVSRTARQLGLSRTTVYKHVRH